MNILAAKITSLLKEKRTELAKNLGQEPFKILHNETIERIAEAKPRTEQELLLIKGIGEKKADQFGGVILSAVREALGEHDNDNDNGNGNGNGNDNDKVERVLTVAEFLNSLNHVLRGQRCVVEGEIVGTINRRGNANYFVLKDKKEEAILHCFAWQAVLDSVEIILEEGMVIKIDGYPEVWKPTGRLSFRVEELFLTGEGALKKAFEALKRKLDKERLFDSVYKKSLPRFVERIGLITAAQREAFTDFLTHLAKCGLHVSFYDVRVEGARAVEQIVEAISWFNRYRPDIEVLVLTRGGGGLESLQAFNSEAVARAIFASKIPIVCGVGHEKDVTIADWVADVRASTPSIAAKILSEDWERAPLILNQLQASVTNALYFRLRESRHRLEELGNALYNLLARAIGTLKAELALFYSQLHISFDRLINFKKFYLSQLEEKLGLANPELKLKQGYSIVRDALKEKIIKSVDQIKVSDKINVRFYQGEAGTRVEEINQ